MTAPTQALEEKLNSFDQAERRNALVALLDAVKAGALSLPEQGADFNIHCHSFFSYNGYGYSPTTLAWRGRLEGLYAMGLVDFDVLDGVEEFLDACQLLGIRAGAGMESRVFVPEFSSRVINSPGEPGIAYHMGMGFTSVAQGKSGLLAELRGLSEQRYRGMMERINGLLREIALDYDGDARPLTPKGNVTERHLCAAYDAKAQVVFPERDQRVAYWAEKLGVDAASVQAVLEDAPTFQGLIRAKTMKAGGVGYVKPEGPDFPNVDEFNAAILAAGAIPVFAFLDGSSEGERAMDELLDRMMAGGVAMVNIIPDRNWNIKDPAVKRDKVAKLNDFVAKVKARELPIIVGTEMNAFGQRFVDDFQAPELAVYHSLFLEGAHVLAGHTLLQAHAEMGYLSDWADANISSRAEKNRFYAAVGAKLLHGKDSALGSVSRAQDSREVGQCLGLST